MTFVRLVFLAAVSLSVTTVLAAPSIIITESKQRFPWNGIFDLAYTISGIEDGHATSLKFYAKVDGKAKEMLTDNQPHAVVGSDTLVSNGSFTDTWNAASELAFPETLATNCDIFAVIEDLGAESYPVDATGTPVGIMASVAVVDLSAGPTATEYPVEYWPNVDTGRFNCDVYKTTKLVLRRVNRGKYSIGYGVESVSSTAAYITHADVVANRSFWIGLFELTFKQYSLVCGTQYDASYDKCPAMEISLKGFRGGGSILTCPEGDNFYALLNRKTTLRKGECWDMPTRSQWEIAARGDLKTLYQTGDTLSGIEKYVHHREYAQVGTLLPNSFGMYDTVGNLWEFVLGYFTSPNTYPYYVDVPCADGGTGIVICGASFQDPGASYLSPSVHHWWTDTASQNNIGTRAAIVIK